MKFCFMISNECVIVLPIEGNSGGLAWSDGSSLSGYGVTQTVLKG